MSSPFSDQKKYRSLSRPFVGKGGGEKILIIAHVTYYYVFWEEAMLKNFLQENTTERSKQYSNYRIL